MHESCELLSCCRFHHFLNSTTSLRQWKHPLLFSTEERQSYRFGSSWGGVNEDRLNCYWRPHTSYSTEEQLCRCRFWEAFTPKHHLMMKSLPRTLIITLSAPHTLTHSSSADKRLHREHWRSSGGNVRTICSRPANRRLFVCASQCSSHTEKSPQSWRALSLSHTHRYCARLYWIRQSSTTILF